MSIINVKNLTFAYDGSYDNVFENVSFCIDTDWKLGLTGRNGRGKTTLLQLLTGKYSYLGSIEASVQFEYFPYEVQRGTDTTIDVIEKIRPELAAWEILRELNLLQVDESVLYRPFETLSKGEQTLVLLAALFLRENGYLLIDEPTNHLDAERRAVVGSYLKSKKGFILVSHDRALLDMCTDHILSVNRAGFDIQKGNFSSWWENKEKQDQYETAENEKLAKDIKRLKSAAKRASQWSDNVEKTKYNTKNSGLSADRGYIGHKSAKMMKRAKSIEQRSSAAAREKSLLLKNIEETYELKLNTLSYHSSKLLTLENTAVQYGGRQICKELSFTVERGDRISLSGKNGSGKSSILKLICGEDIDYTGTVIKGSGLIISYVNQDTGHLRGSLTDFASEHNIDESLFKAILRKLDFSRTQFEKDMRDFSGGQKKKVLIAKSLCERAHLLVWDEPLNFIDAISRVQIEDMLLRYKPTMVFVEHDGMFREKIATSIVEL